MTANTATAEPLLDRVIAATSGATAIAVFDGHGIAFQLAGGRYRATASGIGAGCRAALGPHGQRVTVRPPFGFAGDGEDREHVTYTRLDAGEYALDGRELPPGAEVTFEHMED